MLTWSISHSHADGFELRLHDAPLWAELVERLAHLVPAGRIAWLYPLFNWLATTTDRHCRSEHIIPIDQATAHLLMPGSWDWVDGGTDE